MQYNPRGQRTEMKTKNTGSTKMVVVGTTLVIVIEILSYVVYIGHCPSCHFRTYTHTYHIAICEDAHVQFDARISTGSRY